MSVGAANRGVHVEHGSVGANAADPYVRVHQILTIHQATAPALGAVEQLAETQGLNDCLVATGANIARYHLKGPFHWVDYENVRTAMKDARNAGNGKNYPYPRELVFAPVKVVLAEAVPIRAVLSYEVCYPWQAKLATRVAGKQLWLVYAAVAVLNSRFGRSYYEALLAQVPLKSGTPHGLKIPALEQIPVARVDWEYEELGRVVDLTHQLIALHEGREECLAYVRQHTEPRRMMPQWSSECEGLFDQHIRAVDTRLDDALRGLLGLGEAEEDALLRASILPKREASSQGGLFEDWDLLPPLPPPPQVTLLGDPHQFSSSGGGLDANHSMRELQRLLRFWEDVVNSRPPRELYEEAVTKRSAA